MTTHLAPTTDTESLAKYGQVQVELALPLDCFGNHHPKLRDKHRTRIEAGALKLARFLRDS